MPKTARRMTSRVTTCISWSLPAYHLPTRLPGVYQASVCRLDSARHVLELREVERLRPFETALDEHLKRRFDARGVIQAAERDEDRSREALQVAGEHPGAAFGAE